MMSVLPSQEFLGNTGPLESISATIPFEYTPFHDTERSLSQSPLRTTEHGNPALSITSIAMMPLNNHNASGCEQIERESSVDSGVEVSTIRRRHHKPDNNQVIPFQNEGRASSNFVNGTYDSRIAQPPSSFPPQVHVRLYRAQSLSSMPSVTESNQGPDLDDVDENNLTSKRSASEQDVSKPSTQSPWSKLKMFKRMSTSKIFSSLKNLQTLNESQEEVDPKETPNSSSDRIIPQRPGNGNTTQSQDGGTISEDAIKLDESNKKKNVSFALHTNTDTPKQSSFISTSYDYNNDNTNQRQSHFPIQTDNNKLLNRTTHSHDSTLRETVRNSNPDTVIPVLRGPQSQNKHRCYLLTKFTTSLPPDEIAKRPLVVKDATDIHPLISGETVVTDVLSNKLVVFDVNGFPKVTFALEMGSEPWATCVTPAGNMAVALKGQGCVTLWSLAGECQGEFGQEVLASPCGICDDGIGRYIVTDEKNNVYLFSKSGQFLGNFLEEAEQDEDSETIENRTTFNQPRYACVSRDGYYFISDSANQKVKIFNEDGILKREIGSYGREDGQFRFPYGIAFDESSKLLYVADHFNNRVSVFDLDGSFQFHILTEDDGITRPKGLAILKSKLYVTFGNLRAGNISLFQLTQTK